MHRMLLSIAAGMAGSSAFAAPASVDVAAARASMTGKWTGQLEYLDYSANKWFGIPVVTTVEDQGDGATTIRRSDFDDGPKVGTVRITTVELFDPAKGVVTTGSFRKGRPTEMTAYTVRMGGTPKDAAHWTMIEETKSEDDDRPAMLRLTTVRAGDRIQTLKEVDFLDDAKSEWMSRNRVTLMRMK
jgi:hypothetical protein